ncbi:hypothetical protein CAI21_21200 [Alkalilimnicola ehrlichii]|uniref:ComEC/Rec2-related protein domain-containing protein n=1 Tax=Alkalilimnicola ehrlichii TaxID=351052 RepID=A0A3E0WLE6_9GAMM|nr:ComEC/Rec2 family competence protein [Alkalilimnicola ehrlichii]RFA24554.1 hypothetical protein CAI21_21200 [Alkalilimnicola ehrlichii]RFA33780.1 hypothetical protein CAL65_16725 [Alkalilimnicola ehrlichii]
MRFALILFAVGVIAFHLVSLALDRAIMLVLLLIAAWLAFGPRRWVISAMLFGLVWASAYTDWALSQQLDAQWHGAELEVIGRVVSIPDQDMRRVRFLFKPEAAVDAPSEFDLPRRIRISWYGTYPDVSAGEVWQLRVRLQVPPPFDGEGFDYQRWLFVNRIDAIGFTQPRAPATKLSSGSGLHYYRERLGLAIYRQVDDLEAAGLLVALVVGDRQFIESRSWDALTHTGTGHLLAISGLHIGLVAACGFFLISSAWRRSAWLVERCPAPVAAACGALCAAALYAALAGFTLPTQRALIMLAVGFGGILGRRFIHPWQAFALALAAVLAWDPNAPLTAGFWLSFGAVAAILLLVLGRSPERYRFWATVKLQVGISLALFPLMLVWFNHVPISSPVANLIAIPAVSVLVVPFALMGAVFVLWWPSLGALFLAVAAFNLQWIMPILARLGQWSAPYGDVAQAPVWALLLAAIGVFLALAPRGTPGRLLWVPLILPMWLVTAGH